MAKKKSSRKGKSSGGNIDALFKGATPSRGFRNLPTGTYEGFVKPGSAIMEPKSKGSQDYKASLVLVVSEDGDLQGREQTARYDLSTQVGVDIFTGDLEAMELGKPESLAEAAEMLADSDGISVEFWVSEPKDDYPPKVRISERLEGDADTSTYDDSDDDDADDADGSLSAEDIRAMSEEELTELAADNDLNPDDYETWEELADVLVNLLVE